MSTTAQSQQALPTGTWNLDAAHSLVGFELPYMGLTFRGSFSPVEATLESADGEAKLTGVAKAENVQVQDENLNAHLLSPEFFDAERAPELRFESRSIRAEGTDVVVDGELTIRGTTEPVELRGTIAEPLTDAYGRERLGLELGGTVDRTRFGIDWNAPLPTGEPALPNDVTLVANLYLVKG
jgi:polyisoprenoid-binding protein YceI